MLKPDVPSEGGEERSKSGGSDGEVVQSQTRGSRPGGGGEEACWLLWFI